MDIFIYTYNIMSSGISYRPPTEDLAIFDSSVFLPDDPITSAHLSGFLQFPIGQGAETIPSLTVPGTSNLGVTNASSVNIGSIVSSTTMSQSGAGVFSIDNNESTSGSIVFKANTSLSVEKTLLTLDADLGATFNSGITVTDGVNTNTLSTTSWSGDIASVNTVANLTHYLGFFDSSSTGSGKPQKTASLSCNPSTGTITATTFDGSVSNASGVSLTSDNTSGTYYLPFSKTTTATGNALFIDNTTTPLTYNPLASTLTCSIFSGSATTAAITDTNDATTYYPVFVSASGSTQTLRADLTTGPFSYVPSNGNLSIIGSLTTARVDGDVRLPTTTSAITSFTAGVLSLSMGVVSFRNFGWIVTGATNTMSGLTLASTVVNGVYNVCIINNGSGNLTLNTGLTGGTYYLKYTSAVVVPAGSLAVITINILSVNTITRVIVDAYNVA